MTLEKFMKILKKNDVTTAANKIFIAPPYLDKREKPLTEKGNDNAEHT